MFEYLFDAIWQNSNQLIAQMFYQLAGIYSDCLIMFTFVRIFLQYPGITFPFFYISVPVEQSLILPKIVLSRILIQT